MKSTNYVIELPYNNKNMSELTADERTAISSAATDVFCEALGLEIKETLSDETYGDSYLLGFPDDDRKVLWSGLNQTTSTASSSYSNIKLIGLSNEGKIISDSDKSTTSDYYSRIVRFYRSYTNNCKIGFKIYKDKNFIIMTYPVTEISSSQTNIDDYINKQSNSQRLFFMISKIDGKKECLFFDSSSGYFYTPTISYTDVLLSARYSKGSFGRFLGFLKDNSSYIFSPYIYNRNSENDLKINNIYWLYSNSINPPAMSELILDGEKYFCIYNYSNEYTPTLIKIEEEEEETE